MTLSVHVVGHNVAVETMFKEHDFALKDNEDADLVCFTGGADVTPFLYGEKPVAIDDKVKTIFDVERDLHEIKVWHAFADKPKVGICRGAQFLNVMSGGRLWQHVTKHLGNHEIKYVKEYIKKGKENRRVPVYETLEVTSTHHQQMRPGEHADVIGLCGLADKKYDEKKAVSFPEPEKYELDPEIIYYWHTTSICFQPHPEYVGAGHPCRELFFKLINDYLIPQKKA